MSPADVVTLPVAMARVGSRSREATHHACGGGTRRPHLRTLVRDVVCGTLNAMGIDVIDLGLSTTPTVELAVLALKADGGLI